MATKKNKPAIAPFEKKKVSKGKGLKMNKPLSIKLNVSGGLHNEKYNFDFDLAKNKLSCGVDCKLSKRKSHLKQRSLNDSEVKKLIDVIEKTKMFDLKLNEQKFLPCTLVGRLEVTLGGKKYKTVYAADEEQAKLHKQNNKGLDQTLNEIYNLAAKKMKIKNARP